ncbi:MAG: hypothetical protein WC683_12765 [bacterium]
MNSQVVNTVRINVDSLVGNLQVNLQHLFDLVHFSNVASSSAQEAEYNASSFFQCFMPAQNQRLGFAEVKAKFAQWCMITSFEDAINYIHHLLDEAFTVCEILKSRQVDSLSTRLFMRILNKLRPDFHTFGLPKKLERLRDGYGVNSAMEEHILSFNRVRNCLVHRLGIVGAQDVRAGSTLVAKFRQMQFVATNPTQDQEIIIDGPITLYDGWTIGVRFIDDQKEFRLGERIIFTEKEHFSAIFTFFLFGQTLRNSICNIFQNHQTEQV